MLIPIEQLRLTVPVRGVLHLGAHECEERDWYHRQWGLSDEQIVWIEANPEKVSLIQKRHPEVHVISACVLDQDHRQVSFMITNNGQSSSVLEFGTHQADYPGIVETKRITLPSKTIKTLYQEHNLDPKAYNFYNLDIQGVELAALKGAEDLLNHVDYIYTEINIQEVYKGGTLLHDLDEYLQGRGFQRSQTKMTPYGWGDAFYTRRTTK